MNFIIWNSFTDLGAAHRPASGHSIASWLRQNGYSVKVIDFCALMETQDLVNLTEMYINEDTLSVGVSTTFWENIGYSNAIENGLVHYEPEWVLAARKKLEWFTGDWILGGAKGTALRLSLKWVHFANEAEDTVLKYLDFKQKKFKLRKSFSILTQNSDFDKFDFIKPHEALSFELSRGCMFKCKFCGYENIGKKKGTYIRTKESIKRQLLENYEKYGTTTYTMVDDTVNESSEKIKDLADIAQNLPFELNWVGFFRADLIARHNNLSVLKDSGFRSTYLGIETFHPIAAKAIGKGWSSTPECKKLLTTMAKDDSISIQLGMIIGLPGETKQDIYDSYQWCVDNNIPAVTFHGLGISKNAERFDSEFSKNYEKYGYSFPLEDNNFYWESSTMNEREAMDISNDIMKVKDQYGKNKISSFNATVAAGPSHEIGIKFNDLFKMNNSFFSTRGWKDANKKMINDYITSHGNR
jgi:DNA repair photolyase